MRKQIKPRRASRVQVTPAELELEDINLMIGGWKPPAGEYGVLRTEDAFHDFLRRYGGDWRGWDGPHPPEGYDLELELEKTVAWQKDEDPRLTPCTPGLEPPARIKQNGSKPKRRPRPKSQVAAKAARSEDSKSSPAPEAVKEEAQKPKNKAWFYPAGGSGGSTNPGEEPWPELFEEGEPD